MSLGRPKDQIEYVRVGAGWIHTILGTLGVSGVTGWSDEAVLLGSPPVPPQQDAALNLSQLIVSLSTEEDFIFFFCFIRENLKGLSVLSKTDFLFPRGRKKRCAALGQESSSRCPHLHARGHGTVAGEQPETYTMG